MTKEERIHKTKKGEEVLQAPKRRNRKNLRALKDVVWKKMEVAKGHNPKQYRKDQCGNLIHYDSYGKRSEIGWQIDHMKPISKGGTDHLNNLIGMQWRENASKGNKYPFSKKKCKKNPKGVRTFEEASASDSDEESDDEEEVRKEDTDVSEESEKESSKKRKKPLLDEQNRSAAKKPKRK